ncbi:MAG: aldehyde ferredoxin oxidoreductase family protein [Deltaproteobacteria bacterium]|nr:aldehyde ferredoxin oxidoreductase family protein [Deltaproteobacteria bacterium]
MHGYHGRILHVDLRDGSHRVEPFDDQFARRYLEGACEPEGDEPGLLETPYIAVPRPLGAAALCRCHATLGGRVPVTRKRAGYDASVLHGQAPAWRYLVVTDQVVELRPAEACRGMTTRDTVTALQGVEGADSDVAAIGPAGEHQVRYACIATYWKNREGISGRGGTGAVMGSKRLKALVIKGARRTTAADPAACKAFVTEFREPIKKGTAVLNAIGTPALVNMLNALGAMGTRNLQQETWEHAAEISGERMKEHYFDKHTTCHSCSVACGKQYHVPEGEFAGLRAKMPEYETIYALGPMLEVHDAPALIKANELCDYLGLDSITMGVTIAFALECYERGVLTRADTGGLELRWGDPHLTLRLIELTARREGFGQALAEGSARLAEQLGEAARPYLLTIKGLELPGHSPRALKGMSIGYATGTRGGSHHDTRPTPQYMPNFDRFSTAGKPEFAIRSQHFTAVDDSLVQCRFVSERGGFGLLLNENYARMLNGITGWGVSAADIETIGERICNLERAFNVREGIRRKDDVLPPRVMHEPLGPGASEGMYCPPDELDRMLDEYYDLRGWDREGIPTVAKLRALGLDDLRLP